VSKLSVAVFDVNLQNVMVTVAGVSMRIAPPPHARFDVKAQDTNVAVDDLINIPPPSFAELEINKQSVSDALEEAFRFIPPP
jgi:hypothetical protein